MSENRQDAGEEVDTARYEHQEQVKSGLQLGGRRQMHYSVQEPKPHSVRSKGSHYVPVKISTTGNWMTKEPEPVYQRGRKSTPENAILKKKGEELRSEEGTKDEFGFDEDISAYTLYQDSVLDLSVPLKDTYTVLSDSSYDPPTASSSHSDFIYCPSFILSQKSESAAMGIPANVRKLMDRRVTETVIPIRDRTRRIGQEKEAIQVSQPLEEIPWRRENSEEEQKIALDAKETTEKRRAPKTEIEIVQRTVTSTLNKLSPSNLDKLKRQLLAIALRSDENLVLVTKTIFEKACVQSKYTQVYASLCHFFNEHYTLLAQACPGQCPKKNVRP